MRLPALGRGGRPLRIAYGRIFHEANARSPLRTHREDFERFHHLVGEEVAEAASLRGKELRGYLAHAELTGFRQAARLAGDVTTIPLTSSLAVPNGPLSPETFEWVLGGLVDRLRDAGPVDGVYLALHGSMQVDELEAPPEAVILERVREVVGPDTRIAVSYDLHANLSAGLVDPVDVLVAYRTNPHRDLLPTGFRAGNRLVRVLRDQVEPVHAWRKLPMVLGGGTTIDFLAPMRGVFRDLRRLEDDPRVLTASLLMVHPYTTAEELGWAVHVSTDGDQALADTLADRMADRAWGVRRVPMPPMREVDEAVDEVRRSPWRRVGPVTLVDCDDVVGAGAPGGNTHFVRSLARDDRGLVSYVPVHDPAAVESSWNVPLGHRVRLTLRGTPGYGQPEVELDAVVAARATTEFGRTVRLTTGGLHVAVSERSPLPVHPKFWRELGVSARRADLIVQKNFFHYRMFYATTSFQHLPVVSAGATSFEPVRSGDYPVATYPGDDPPDWREGDRVLRRGRRGRPELGASVPPLG